MKHLLSLPAAILFTVTLVKASEVPWWTFTGGGGIAQHGAIALGGAIGPIAPALAPATGGNYTLTGGFWPAFPGQPQTASPVLRIKSVGDGKNVLLSWPVAVNGFTLEYNPQPGSGLWFTEQANVTDTATEHTVTVPAQSQSRWYRLRSE